MFYCDTFWRIDAHKNNPSPACLIVFVKSKTDNQLIRSVTAYKNVKQLQQRETPNFIIITPDLLAS